MSNTSGTEITVAPAAAAKKSLKVTNTHQQKSSPCAGLRLGNFLLSLYRPQGLLLPSFFQRYLRCSFKLTEAGYTRVMFVIGPEPWRVAINQIDYYLSSSPPLQVAPPQKSEAQTGCGTCLSAQTRRIKCDNEFGLGLVKCEDSIDI